MTDSTLGAMQHRVRNLTLWHGHVEPEPLPGGLSNQNFMVRDGADGYVVRLVGGDDPAHGIVREREVAVSRAAHRAGIAPELVHVEPGILVFRFVAGRVLTEREVRGPAMLDRIAELLRRCHRDVAAHLRGPAPCFWVFHALRDYLAQLDSQGVLVGRTERLRGIAGALERVVGPIDLALTHNDLMPGNIIDDGERLWLIDWEYGGFGAPLFDLASRRHCSPPISVASRAPACCTGLPPWCLPPSCARRCGPAFRRSTAGWPSTMPATPPPMRRASSAATQCSPLARETLTKAASLDASHCSAHIHSGTAVGRIAVDPGVWRPLE